MTSLSVRLLSASVGVLALALLTAPASATALDTVTSLTSVSINSATSVADGDANDRATSSTAQDLALSAASTTNRAFSNGSGGFVIKSVKDDVFASASLADGALKTRAELAFGGNLAGSASIPIGVRNGAASASASFGDSFHAYANGSPFLWNNGDSTTFQFAVTGTSSITGTGTVTDPTGYGAGQPINNVTTLLRFTAFQTGGLDLYNQLRNFDFGTQTYGDYLALNSQVEALKIASDYWYLGDFIAPYDEPAAKIYAVNDITPTVLSLEFIPVTDFDWVLTLDTTVFLDAALQNVDVLADFSHTILTTVQAPDDVEFVSGSGVFPGTLAVVPNNPNNVPEPGMIALLGLGLAGALAARRKRG